MAIGKVVNLANLKIQQDKWRDAEQGTLPTTLAEAFAMREVAAGGTKVGGGDLGRNSYGPRRRPSDDFEPDHVVRDGRLVSNPAKNGLDRSPC